jgi:hypothetical protein
LYKYESLLTAEELDESETFLEATKEGNLDQKEASHLEDDLDEDDIQEVVGPVIRKKT